MNPITFTVIAASVRLTNHLRLSSFYHHTWAERIKLSVWSLTSPVYCLDYARCEFWQFPKMKLPKNQLMAGLEDKLTICLQMLNGTLASRRIYEEDGKSIKARVKTLNLNV